MSRLWSWRAYNDSFPAPALEGRGVQPCPPLPSSAPADELTVVCAWCLHQRGEDGTWQPVPATFVDDGTWNVTHGICPACFAREEALDRIREVKFPEVDG